MKDTNQLTRLLAEDMDVVADTITAETPSSQKQLLSHSIEQVLSGSMQGRNAIKLLTIAQILLSGTHQFFNETEATALFRRFVELSAAAQLAEIKDSALTIASLLLNRARQQLSVNVDSDLTLLNEAGRSANSEHQQKVLSAMQRKAQASKARLDAQKARRYTIPDLNILAAAQNVMEDVAGDWYRDPWGWPEVEWLGKCQPNIVSDRLRDDACDWTIPLDVSKRDGSVRPAMLINPLDRVAFQALVDDLSLEAAGDLPSWVHGWRLQRGQPRKGVYESNYTEWSRFSGRVSTYCKLYPFTAHLDIRSFFQTVDTSRLLAQLTRRYRNEAVIDRLEAYFHAWHERQNGAGLPQRSLASSVLAHVVLRPLDAFISTLSNRLISSRWMDDIWLHSHDEGVLRACLKEVEYVLAEMGLGLNAEKTELFRADQADEVVNLVNVYEADEDDDPSLTLEDLAAEPPFQISKKVGKLLKNKNFTSLDHIPEDRWMQFNYLSRALARGFRVSGNWKRFVDIYVDFARRHASAANLSVASWAEMFPNTPDPAVRKVQAIFSENVIKGPQRLLTPLASQRLVAWSSVLGPGGLTEFDFQQSAATSDTLRARGVIFATLRLGVLKDKAMAAARETDELTFQFLKDSGFAPPPLSPKFEAE
jgi:hypothetical protein